jgi:thymidylate synthase (FAD)
MSVNNEFIDPLEKREAERLDRPRVEALDQILGQPLKVLDDGFVRVVDYMGSDESIVQAARVSYGKGTRKVSEDRGLIRYLMRHRHTTPFEMCEIKFHVRVPMDCWRQFIRHRMVSVNELSTRYSIAIDSEQKTPHDQWRGQSTSSRQGSEGFIDPKKGKELSATEAQLIAHARSVYEERLAAGVAREQARKDLPLSTYTEAYWKIDLHNLFHFLSLRMDAHAQLEIRDYAKTMGYEVVRRWCPIAWEAFLDYRVETMSLTRLDMQIVGALGQGDAARAIVLATEFGWLARGEKGLKRNRERAELETKLERLNLPIPWRE